MRPFVILGLVTLVAAACEDTTSPMPSGAPGSGGRIAANRVLDGNQGFDFTTIDAPGAQFILGHAVNSSGAIVGWFFSSGGQHGFLLSNGTLTQIDFNSDPNVNSMAAGINDAGDIVGDYSGTDERRHSYLLREGTYTTFDVSGARHSTALAINSNGDIVGIFSNNSGAHGFLANASNLASFTTIDFPGALNTTAAGINDAGDIVGVYLNTSDEIHGFLLSGGRFTSLDVPGALATQALSINNVGQIVGGDVRGGIRSLTEPGFPAPLAERHGFLLSGGLFIPVNISGVGGGVNTRVFGISSTGVIVGQYDGTDGVTHAFVGTPRIVP